MNYGDRYLGRVVAITGASGYLASALLAELGLRPARILCVSRTALPIATPSETLRADVREPECWRQIIATADVIFHLAGNTSVYAAAEDPAASLASTVAPVMHLIHAARMLGRQPVVVFAGTATQYGLTSHLPVDEDTPLRPVTNYDLHKAQAEAQLLLATHHGILRGISLRLANVYGPSAQTSSASDRGIINKVTQLALRGAPLSLYGGGDYLRDYVYVADVARAFLAAGATPAAVGHAFNVGTGRGLTVREAFYHIAGAASRAIGMPVPVREVPWPTGADPIERRSFVAAVDRLRMTAGWIPTVNFETGVAALIAASQPTAGTCSR